MAESLLVIIVTYNPMHWIDRCLQSVLNSTIKADIIVIDNGSSDGSQKHINNTYPQCQFIQNESNIGFGAANNIGLRYALENAYDYVYLMNQDAWINPDTFEILINESQANPQFGIISPMHLQGNGTHLDSFFRQLISRCPEYVEESFFHTGQSLFEINFVNAAHWLISNACLKVVGGFSPSFYHYGEDDNYCDRARFHGYKVGFSLLTFGIHDRENRVIGKDRRLFHEHINMIIAVSRPGGEQRSLLFYLRDSLSSSRRNKSVMPLRYFSHICIIWRRLKKNREISKNQKAFL